MSDVADLGVRRGKRALAKEANRKAILEKKKEKKIGGVKKWQMRKDKNKKREYKRKN